MNMETMSQNTLSREQLVARVVELEQEVRERQADLKRFREELDYDEIVDIFKEFGKQPRPLLESA